MNQFQLNSAIASELTRYEWTYTDPEGRAHRLDNVKPCFNLTGWVHGTIQGKPYTICAWGNHGIKVTRKMQ